MKAALKRLLDNLEHIGSEHEELYDTEVRQRMSNAIVNGFARSLENFSIPDDFGMFSQEANIDVKRVISTYISEATRMAIEMTIDTFHGRLHAMQDASVRSSGGNDYEEFLGHSSPEFFDEQGIVIRTQ